MATKTEIKEQEDLKEWLKVFKELKEDEAKEYITDNVYLRKVSKGLISAYISTYHKKDDNSWFKKAAIIEKPKYAYTIVCDKAGQPIMKYSEKQGKAIPKKERVEVLGKSIKTYDHNKAKAAFIEHYDITVKATTFEAKEKRTDEVFDVFAGLLD